MTPLAQHPSPLLAVRDLRVSFRTETGEVVAVERGALELYPGETLAVVGESGSGKSTVANAIIGLLPPGGRIVSGELDYQGTSLTSLSPKLWRRLRRREIGYVPQDTGSSLNPVWTIGAHLQETLAAQGVTGRAQRRARGLEALRDAGLSEPQRLWRLHPHELSGGMRQRVLIALAISGSPRLVIADEPTSALDVTVQRRVLDRLAELAAERELAVLLITHDLGLAADRAERIIVMKDGRVVEAAQSEDLLGDPRHPYTRRLLEAVPRVDAQALQGSAAVVHAEAGQRLIAADAVSKTYRVRSQAGAEPSGEIAAGPDATGHTTSGIDAAHVTDTPPASSGFVRRLRRGAQAHALREISLELRQGEAVALVGESGSGKSTLARLLLALETPSSGTARFGEHDIAKLRGSARLDYRARVQAVFQDPYSSLNPRFTVRSALSEPLRLHRRGDAATRRQRVEELLDLVALPRALADRYPVELSGGQRQRVAIARALALDPEVLICDEAVSALDVVVQAQILQLLRSLRERLGLSVLFITHDLAVVAEFADRVVVLRSGQIVEEGTVRSVFLSPKHRYTRELLDAIPGRGVFTSTTAQPADRDPAASTAALLSTSRGD